MRRQLGDSLREGGDQGEGEDALKDDEGRLHAEQNLLEEKDEGLEERQVQKDGQHREGQQKGERHPRRRLRQIPATS